jgi:hypothetical protein
MKMVDKAPEWPARQGCVLMNALATAVPGAV